MKNTVDRTINIAQLNSGKWKAEGFNDIFDTKDQLKNSMNSKLENGNTFHFIEVEKLNIK